jgi:hypothetical protein
VKSTGPLGNSVKPIFKLGNLGNMDKFLDTYDQWKLNKKDRKAPK